MRLNGKLSIIAKAVGIELCILALIGLVFLFQFNKAKEDFVTKTRAISETIGDLAGDFYSEAGAQPTSGEFYHFLDKRLGRKKLFNTFEVSPKFFSVVFKRDVEEGSGSEGLFMGEFYPESGYTVTDTDGIISVSVPFSTQAQSEPFGLVKIDSDTSAILKKVFADNYLLYAAMLIVLNNQAFIFYLLMVRKKKEVVFEKGYLKEHSIGALKIMHKVLGDIIEDHKTDDQDAAPEDPKKQQEASSVEKNVISISELADKRKQ
ncbi:MAG: hypothetical protein MI861_29270, partial [Pirellulales bacterium]|nr:hypothetical protein [Pirellulales bacterium]